MSGWENVRHAAEIKRFLAGSPLKSFIGGQWVESANGETFATLDPGSGEKLAEVYAMQESDVDKAVTAGAAAFRSSGWAAMASAERGGYLRRLADLVETRKEVLADLETLDCGKVRAQVDFDVSMVVSTLRYYAEVAASSHYSTALSIPGYEARTVRFPYGVCGFIYPWNFPLLLLGWGCAPALAAGNTVVIKPAEDTPLSSLYLGQLVAEAGIPAGVFNVIAGPGATAGAALVRHPGLKRMSFTGSPEVGKQVGKACGANLVPVKLELGGKGAAVLFDDIDIEDTATKLASAITFHSGQVCSDATRWIIHEKIYDAFVAAVQLKLQAVRVGYGFEAATQMGPVVSARQRRRVLSYLRRGLAQGAEAVLSGGACKVQGYAGGFYVKPALLAGSLDNVAAREEVFGPVAYLTRFRDEAEGIALANHTAYGLANSVWSKDLARCQRVAEAMVAANSWINAHNVFPLGVPYGGINLSGMGGGVNSPETFRDYLRQLSVVRPPA